MVRNYFNPPIYLGEINNEPSMTVPDQTMSMRTILERYSRGLSIDNGQTPIYEGEEGLGVDVRTLDLAERMDLAEQVAEELQQLKDEMSKKQSEKAKQNVINEYLKQTKEAEQKTDS